MDSSLAKTYFELCCAPLLALSSKLLPLNSKGDLVPAVTAYSPTLGLASIISASLLPLTLVISVP